VIENCRFHAESGAIDAVKRENVPSRRLLQKKRQHLDDCSDNQPKIAISHDRLAHAAIEIKIVKGPKQT